jgi:hypothetical protein
MLEQWQCSQHRMRTPHRTVRRRIYAAHLTACRGILEQLEQVEIDAFPTAFVTASDLGRKESGSPSVSGDLQMPGSTTGYRDGRNCVCEVIELDTRYPEAPRTFRYDERRGGCVDRKFGASK